MSAFGRFSGGPGALMLENEMGVGRRVALTVVAVAGLAGCGVQDPQPTGIHDPYEGVNRGVHAFNKGFDTVVFKAPPGKPRTIDNAFVRSVSNAGSNLGLPSKVVNSILQGRPAPAMMNTFRFLVNTTVGIGGLFDPAGTAMNLPEQDTDFGETLAVWGVHEGDYVELPLFGPSTARDAVGRVVDIAMNPLGGLQGTAATAATATRIAGKAADRKIHGDVIESVLYDSADSYSQSRLMYLQNRRYHLAGQETKNDANTWDPYTDPAQ